jgi:adenylate cyclase
MRRLSAIMFTDMVGYSALSQKNEALALQLLEEHRSILRPFFAKHGGREVETAGDLFFVEFESAVEGVNCAVEIQTTLYERNNVADEDNKIVLRIGLHIGDVVYVDNHVHGDGVNIAARIEPLAKPGGICVSEDVARQIRNKVNYPIVKMGVQKLKNISTPIEIYCVQFPWHTQDQRTPKKFPRVKKLSVAVGAATVVTIIVLGLLFFFSRSNPSEIPNLKFRLAVLPLDNISADVKDEYFADGMTEELISNLSKIGHLRVIARSSIMKYKGLQKTISEIGEELMVGTILEGSVRKVDNKARITVQLIDVSTQEHIWSMDYDRNLQDIFLIQSEIARNVASTLQIILPPSEKTQLEKRYTGNMDAFQEYLIGKHFLNNRTSESIRTAVQHFEKSIARDPEFALAYASLSYCYTLISGAGYGGFPEDMANKKAKDAVMKALELDQTLAEAHAALAYIKFRIDWDWDEADKEFMQAIELKPGYSTAHEWYALYLAIHKRLDESLQQMTIAHELDPLSSSVNTGLGRIYHFRGEMDKAIEQLKKTIELDPNYAEAYFGLGMAYFKIKNYQEAETEIMKALQLSNRRPVILGILGALYASTGRQGEALKLLDELQNSPINNDKMYAASTVLISLNRTDEAFEKLEKLYAVKYGILIYFNVERTFFGEENAKKILPLIKKMGFKE